MSLQIIRDGNGKNTGIFVPINDWNEIVEKYEDIKALVNPLPVPKKNFRNLQENYLTRQLRQCKNTSREAIIINK